jgi:hypothetical protein
MRRPGSLVHPMNRFAKLVRAFAVFAFGLFALVASR